MTSDISSDKAVSTHKDPFGAITQTLWRKRVMVCAITLLGVSSTALYIKSTPRIYRADLQIVFKNEDQTEINTQREYLLSPALLQSAARDLNLPSTADIQNLDAYHIPNSYVLALSYQSSNPKYAARLLNKTAATYIKNYKPSTAQPSGQKASKATLDALRDHEKTLLSTLRQVQNYTNTEAPSVTTNTQNHELEKIRLEYIETKSQLSLFLKNDGTLKLNPKASVILNDPEVQELKQQQSQKQQELNKLSQKYGHKHPQIIALNSDLTLIRNEITRKSTAIMRRIQNKYDTLEAQISALDQNYTHEIQTTGTENPQILKIIKMLKGKIQDNRTLQNELQQGVVSNGQIRASQPRILKMARVPQKAISPNAPKIMASGTALSFLFAILLVLLNERLRNTFLSARQLEEFLNLPCYALIPKIEKDKTKPTADYITDNPSSILAESVRTLQLVLKLRQHTQSPENQIISITSSLQNEGKTTLSCWLAKLSAKSGKRVILIDTDLRSPSVHKCFGKANKLSLVEYLGGHKKLEDIIDTSDASGLHIIYGRSVPGSALDLISSDKMEQLVRSLRQTYDIVILDTPACMAVSDARALQKLSDQILYAVAWNKTPRKLVHNGITQFTKFGNTEIATVLTSIDLKKHVQFGYGDTINDYGSYNEE